MEKIDLNEYLASNEYPGRGIAVAMAPDGRQMFIGYFIMGRSENSRNRVFDPIPERGGICTVAADPDKLEDPSLIIYNPVLTLGKTQIVTNGDQTDTIRDALAAGGDFASALRTREFEPDGRAAVRLFVKAHDQIAVVLRALDRADDDVFRTALYQRQPRRQAAVGVRGRHAAVERIVELIALRDDAAFRKRPRMRQERIGKGVAAAVGDRIRLGR